MRRRYLVLALLLVLAALLYVDRVCISFALPRIQDDLGIGPEQLGWIAFAFSLSYAAFEIPSGHMGDRIGPRRVLTRIVLGWSAFTALTGTATGLGSLLVMRFFFGAGEAGAFPNASTAVSRWFPPRGRAAAMGAIQGAAQLGAAVAPLLVIPIQQRYGWRAAFFVLGTCGLAWALVWRAWFRDTPAEKASVGDAELAELAGAPKRAAHGLPWSVALRSRTLWGLVVAFSASTCSNGLTFWVPMYLVKARAFTEAELRWVSLSWILMVAGSTGGGFSSDRLVAMMGHARGRRVVAIAALGGHALATVALAATHDKAAAIALLGMGGFFGGFFAANAMAACIDIGDSHAGTVTAAMNTAGQAAGGLSGVVFGYLVRASGSYDAPVLVIAGVLAAGTLPCCLIDASRKIVTGVRASGV